ncbi:MAG: YceI family protein [Silicimonas sp.]|nr:YceI family protein [Silicimonas sp.]
MDRRLFLALAGTSLAVRPAHAAASRYNLDRANSTVAFTYRMNGQPMTGRMPVASADILLDVDQPPNSRVAAEIDAGRADAGPFYATEAMKSQSVLYTARYPRISFRSEAINGSIHGARIQGPLTVRNVTEPITLDAVIYRQRGTVEGDRRNLSILMTGTIDRRRFGAGGFPDIVDPTIWLQILTRITLA